MAIDFKNIVMKYRDLKDDPFFPFNDIQDNYIVDEYETEKKMNTYISLKETLNSIPQNDIDYFKNKSIRGIEIVVQSLKKNKMGYPLSRNQGLLIPNYVFGKVIGVLKSAIGNGYGISYPNFYYSTKGDFNEKPLKVLLESAKKSIYNQEYNTFFDLENEVDNLINKVGQMWDRENENYPEDSY